jgi:hypothetical protein
MLIDKRSEMEAFRVELIHENVNQNGIRTDIANFELKQSFKTIDIFMLKWSPLSGHGRGLF